jgi:hypothetical protein
LLRSLDALVAGFEKHGIEEELRSYLRDVSDHATTVAERVDSFRQMLQDILTVNATLITQAQNEEMKSQNEEVKKISAWAAILFLDAHRHGLRHELPAHARTALVLRLSVRPGAHGRRLRGALSCV